MKTITARFTEVKKNVSDIEGDIEDVDINKVDAALKSVGISLKDNAGQIRNLDDVILELSASWSDLDRNTQRYIATMVAGSRQQSRFLALVENYERTQQLIEIAQDSAGRSSEQFAKYADSVENKVNRLKNTWEQFRINLVDEKFYKNILDLGNTILSKFTKVNIGQLGVITVWAATIGKNIVLGVANGIKNAGNILTTGIENLTAKLKGHGTKIEIQTNLRDITDIQIPAAKARLEELKNTFATQSLGNLPAQGFNNLEAALNRVNYTLDQTKTEFQLLDISENSHINVEQFLIDKLGMSRLQASLTAQEIEKNKQKHLEAAQAIKQQSLAVEELTNKEKALKNALALTNNLSTAARSLGSAIGTMITMGITGTFNAEQVGTTIAIQLASSGVTTAINAAAAAVGRQAGVGFSEAFLASSGGAGLILTGIAALIAILTPLIKKWTHEWKMHHDAVYQAQQTYDKATEAAKKSSEALDEQKKKLEEIADTYKEVEDARTTFEQLNQKIILTDEEQQKLNESTSQLAELMPSLISYYDAQGNAVIKINERYKEQIKLLKEQVALEEEKTAIANITAIEDSISKSEKAYNVVEALFNENSKFTYQYDFDKAGNEKWTSTSFFENPKEAIDIIVSKYTSGAWDTQQKFKVSEQLEKALLDAFNDTLGKKYNELGDALNEYDYLINIGKDREVIEQAKKNYIKYLKEISDVEDEAFDSYFEQEKQKVENDKELRQGLTTLYQSLFKKELLKYNDSERKNMMTSIFNNMLLNDEDTLNKYYQKKEELGRTPTTNEFESLISFDELSNIATEVEELTPELYKSLEYFYNNLSALTSTELEQIIEQFKEYELIYNNLQSLVNQNNNQKLEYARSFAEKYGQYRYTYNKSGQRENTLPSYLQNLVDNSSETIIEKVFNKVEDIAEEKGAEAKKKYIEAFNNATAGKSESYKNFLLSQDWSNINSIHEDSQIRGIAAQMVSQGLSESIGKAEKEIRAFIENTDRDILGIRTGLESIGDIENVKEVSEKGFELFQENADAFTVIYAAKADKKSLEVTQKEFKKLWDTIDKINKAKDSPYNIDFSKYFSTENGKFVIKDLKNLKKELEEPIKGISELEAKVKELQETAKIATGTDKEVALGMLSEAQNALDFLRAARAYIKEFGDEARKSVTTFRDIEKSISSISSDYQSIVKEQEEDGFLSAKSLSGFLSNIKELNENLEDTPLANRQLDASSILSRNEKGYQLSTAALRKYIIELIKATQATDGLSDEDEDLHKRLQSILDDLNAFEAERLKKAQEEALEAAKKAEEEAEKAAEDAKKAMEDAQKAAEDAQKDADEAKDKIKDAEKELTEAQKKVIELQEQLNEVLYGTGNKRKSTLDGMYNYEQRLSEIANRLEDVKTSLEDINNDSLSSDVYSYGSLMHGKKVTLLGQQSVYSNNLAAIRSELAPYSEYFTEVNGRLLADVARLNAAQMNDKYKDWIESQISAYNDSVDKIHSIKKEIESVEKEFLDFQKTYRDKYISLQESVINTLKESAQEEINVNKEKYAAMAEADNDYITALEEAIRKQRELRQLEQETNELSQKEKKLSLLQRDTSGSRKKDVLKQQKDVDKAKQTLSDKNVDNIIKNLKELYKQQKETRDAEIQYQEQVLNNATYIEEANAIIQSWGTADEMIGWFIEHNQKTQEMTAEQLEKYSDELREMYNAREIYMTTSMKDFSEMLNVQQKEIDEVTANTAEHLTSEAHRAFEEVKKEVDDAIEKAKDDLDEAMGALEEAKEKLIEMLNDVTVKLDALKQAQLDAASATQALADAKRDLTAANDEYSKAQDEADKKKKARENEEKESSVTTTSDMGGNTNYTTKPGAVKTNEDKNKTITEDVTTSIGAAAVIGAINTIKDNISNTDFNQGKDAENKAREKKQEEQIKAAAAQSDFNQGKRAENDARDKQRQIEEEKYSTYARKIYDDLVTRAAKTGMSPWEDKNGLIALWGLPVEYRTKEVIDELPQYGLHGYVTKDYSTIYWTKSYEDAYKHIMGLDPKERNNYMAFSKGGLVNYTGPAWVDGTPAQPEAFLSAEDTRNIAHFTDVLSSLYNSFGQFNPTVSSSHETIINVTVNVDGVSSDYDVDRAVERVKQSIIDAANQTGSTVILHQ